LYSIELPLDKRVLSWYNVFMTGIVPWVGGYTPAFTPNPTSTPQPSLRDWWREIQEAGNSKPNSAVTSAVVGLRHNGESAAMGAILALIDTELGGLDLGGRIPLDWLGAALFYVLSIRDTGKEEGISSDFRAMGQSCTTVAMYRMVQRWRIGQKAIPQNNKTKDPVLAAGKTVF
jgi:hypothetical protein